MKFLKNITAIFQNAGGAVQGAVEVVAEKNRKAALQNRLRTVIRCEEKAAERAYLALGRYYYHNLRDAENTVTEPHCVDIEASERRIDAAVERLTALCAEEETDAMAEEITLCDVQEIAPQADEAVPEGMVDEAVEAAAVYPETAKDEAPRDASEDLPYEG